MLAAALGVAPACCQAMLGWQRLDGMVASLILPRVPACPGHCPRQSARWGSPTLCSVPARLLLPCSMSHSEPVNVKKGLEAISDGAAAAPCRPHVIYCGVANGAQIFLNLN